MRHHIDPAASLLFLSFASACAASACAGDARDQTLIVGTEQRASGAPGIVASAPSADAAPIPDPRSVPATMPPSTLEPEAAQVADRAPDAGVLVVSTSNVCGVDAGPRCDLGMGNVLPEDVTVDLFAQPHYFAKGARLPAGRYRISYVDGCNTYGIGVGWTVHAGIVSGDAVRTGLAGCYLLGDDGMPFLQTPGSEVWPAMGEGQTQSYTECVALNCKLPPIDFDFAGGKLAVRRDGGGELGAIDDSGGGPEGGRNPTFRLSRLSGCQER